MIFARCSLMNSVSGHKNDQYNPRSHHWDFLDFGFFNIFFYISYSNAAYNAHRSVHYVQQSVKVTIQHLKKWWFFFYIIFFFLNIGSGKKIEVFLFFYQIFE